jgi:hypothetical protein
MSVECWICYNDVTEYTFYVCCKRPVCTLCRADGECPDCNESWLVGIQQAEMTAEAINNEIERFTLIMEECAEFYNKSPRRRRILQQYYKADIKSLCDIIETLKLRSENALRIDGAVLVPQFNFMRSVDYHDGKRFVRNPEYIEITTDRATAFEHMKIPYSFKTPLVWPIVSKYYISNYATVFSKQLTKTVKKPVGVYIDTLTSTRTVKRQERDIRLSRIVNDLDKSNLRYLIGLQNYSNMSEEYQQSVNDVIGLFEHVHMQITSGHYYQNDLHIPTNTKTLILSRRSNAKDYDYIRAIIAKKNSNLREITINVPTQVVDLDECDKLENVTINLTRPDITRKNIVMELHGFMSESLKFFKASLCDFPIYNLLTPRLTKLHLYNCNIHSNDAHTQFPELIELSIIRRHDFSERNKLLYLHSFYKSSRLKSITLIGFDLCDIEDFEQFEQTPWPELTRANIRHCSIKIEAKFTRLLCNVRQLKYSPRNISCIPSVHLMPRLKDVTFHNVQINRSEFNYLIDHIPRIKLKCNYIDLEWFNRSMPNVRYFRYETINDNTKFISNKQFQRNKKGTEPV